MLNPGYTTISKFLIQQVPEGPHGRERLRGRERRDQRDAAIGRQAVGQPLERFAPVYRLKLAVAADHRTIDPGAAVLSPDAARALAAAELETTNRPVHSSHQWPEKVSLVRLNGLYKNSGPAVAKELSRLAGASPKVMRSTVASRSPSRPLRMPRARSTTASGMPARRATWMP